MNENLGGFSQFLSEWLIEISPKLPFQDNPFVESLRHHREHKFVYEDTRIPQGTTLELAATWVVQAFKIEDLNDVRDGLKFLFDSHPSSRFFGLRDSADRLEKAFKDVQSNPLARGWYNIGFIEPGHGQEKPLFPFVDTIDFQIYVPFADVVLLIVRIEPSERFKKKYLEVSNKHCGEVTILNWKSFIPGKRVRWRASMHQASRVKEKLFEALLSELRGQAVNFLGRYYKDYFGDKGFTPPAFELYLYDEIVAPAPRAQAKMPVSSFWESTGMNRHGMVFSDPSKHIFVFSPFWSHASEYASPIKILIEKNSIVLNSGYQKIESQIIAQVSEWIQGLSPVWTLQHILLCIQRRLPKYRDAIYSYAHSWQAGWWPFLSGISGQKLRLNSDWFTFERLRRDFRLRDVIFRMHSHCPQTFTYTLGSGPNARPHEFCAEMLDTARAHLHETRRIFTTINFAFDEILQVNTLRSNFWLQVIMFLVAIASLIVAGVTLYVTWPHK